MEFLDQQLFTVGTGDPVTVGRLLFALAVLVGGLLLSRFLRNSVSRRLGATTLDVNAVSAISRTVFYGALVAIFFTVLALLDIPLTALAFLSGAVAIGVGFGAQAVINNLISGWILMTTRPVRIGDFVEVEGSLGTVEDIGNRSTKIRRTDGVHLLVPNSIMLDRIVVNWTLVDQRVRTSVKVGVAYGSPVREVERLIARAVDEHESILDEPEPIIFFDDFGDNALAFEVLFWCDVLGERVLRQVRSDLRYRLDELFREAGITIAFPQRDVHLDVSGPMEVRVLRGAGEDSS